MSKALLQVLWKGRSAFFKKIEQMKIAYLSWNIDPSARGVQMIQECSKNSKGFWAPCRLLPAIMPKPNFRFKSRLHWNFDQEINSEIFVWTQQHFATNQGTAAAIKQQTCDSRVLVRYSPAAALLRPVHTLYLYKMSLITVHEWSVLLFNIFCYFLKNNSLYFFIVENGKIFKAFSCQAKVYCAGTTAEKQLKVQINGIISY